MTSAQTIRRVTRIGMLLNIALSAVKGVFGLLAHSQALIADAVHSLSDCVTDMAVIVGAHYWSAPPDETHPHGHARIETLVSTGIGIALAAAGIGIGIHAFTAIAAPPAVSPGWPALAAAVLSIGVKEWMYRWTAETGRRVHSSALAANAWHHRSDALSSVPVALAVIVQSISPEFHHLDAVAAVLVAAMLIKAAWSIARPALNELADAGASRAARAEMESIARSVPGVRGVHALRTRRSGAGYFVDLHILVNPHMTVKQGYGIATAVRNALLHTAPNVVDVLIHTEPQP